MPQPQINNLTDLNNYINTLESTITELKNENQQIKGGVNRLFFTEIKPLKKQNLAVLIVAIIAILLSSFATILWIWTFSNSSNRDIGNQGINLPLILNQSDDILGAWVKIEPTPAPTYTPGPTYTPHKVENYFSVDGQPDEYVILTVDPKSLIPAVCSDNFIDYYEFFKDGSFITSPGTTTFGGKYSLADGSRIKFDIDFYGMSRLFNYKIHDGSLTLTDDEGCTAYYKKN